MKRLRTFEQYWEEATNPAANEAWRVCAQERDEVIQDLRQDLKEVLSYLENVTDFITVNGSDVPVRYYRHKWKL